MVTVVRVRWVDNQARTGRRHTSYSFTDLLISEQIEFVFRPSFTTSPSFILFPFSAILRDLPSLRSIASICPLTFWIDMSTVVFRCSRDFTVLVFKMRLEMKTDICYNFSEDHRFIYYTPLQFQVDSSRCLAWLWTISISVLFKHMRINPLRCRGLKWISGHKQLIA